MNSRKRSLVICNHLPHKDPRIKWHILSLKRNYEVNVLYTQEDGEVLNTGEQIDGVRYHSWSDLIQRSTSPSDGPDVINKLSIRRVWLRSFLIAKDHLRTHFHNYPKLIIWPILTAYVVWRLHTLFRGIKNGAFRFKDRFDLIVANDLDTLPIGAYIKESNGGILIYDSHENWACVRPHTPRLYELAINFYEKKYANHADLITTVSPLLVKHLEQSLRREEVILLPNAAPWFPDDVPRTTSDGKYPAKDRFGAEMQALAQGRLVAIFQGRVTPERGLREIVKAWQYMPADGAILAIRTPSGPNPEMEAVVRMAKTNGTFQRTVFHLPSVSEDELIAAGRVADIGIIPYKPTFPNHIMACPNKLSQYMQAGLAIFSNDIPYVREIVEEAKCGVMYTTNEIPERIADKIIKLCRDQSRLDGMKTNALQFSREKFNWDRFYGDVEEKVNFLSRN